METSKINLILLILVIAIVLVPLIFKSDAEYGGADGQAGDLALEINPNYEPWVEPLWEPPSGEIESLLFSVQVAIGAGSIGYVLGLLKGRNTVASNR
ncbi:MAG: energy-coupling factor ABC transporter substrate-binding protein [Tissierellia bacterium]|nr:energy-coupling factor ABC transporter substrate-binding protein [Tissierellia bacterium]MDD4726305.1 energy-coupling factor ABC transporter substrate-binding protein [Tissierellia bacterium]